MIADWLGLGGDTIPENVDRLVVATEQLLDRLEIPNSIADLGITQQEFTQAVPGLAAIAFDDPSWRPTNIRMPLVSELADLLWQAYHGSARRAAAGLLPSPCAVDAFAYAGESAASYREFVVDLRKS